MIDIEKIHPNIRMFIFIVIIAAAIYGFLFFMFHTVTIGTNSNKKQTTYFNILKDTASNFLNNFNNKPAEQSQNNIRIDKIGVSASIETVGLDQSGNMAAPSSPDIVAWYKEGAEIGDVGTAVISGHKDTSTGKPAVFYHLSNLKKGDIISITENNNLYQYIVSAINTYPVNNFPTEEIFSSNDAVARLNLITCTGSYNEKIKNYTERLVVSAILAK